MWSSSRKPWSVDLVTRECSRFALIRIPTRETRTLKTRRLLADKLGKGLSYSWYPPARDFCVISSQSFPAFYEPWLPSPAAKPPAGGRWLYEIKHDGFRMMVRRDPAGVRLLTRHGNDWTARFPLIAQAAGALRVRSFLIDGEAVACDGDGMPSFDRLRYPPQHYQRCRQTQNCHREQYHRAGRHLCQKINQSFLSWAMRQSWPHGGLAIGPPPRSGRLFELSA
jgi:ATP dependent DNA ligase domain